MKKLFIYIIILLATASCASVPPIVKLTPSTLENKDYWDRGQQFVYANNRNIWFDCAFNRVENGKLVFDVKITNLSDTAVLVDPQLFTQKIFTKDTETPFAENSADNPEEVLTRLHLIENESIAHASHLSVLSICSAILSVGISVATIASDDDNRDKAKTLDKVALGNDIVQVASAASAEAKSVRAQKSWVDQRNLEVSFLRKTTVPKGFYIDGEVHFPYNKKAKWYDLKFTVGNASAYFYFSQELIRSMDQSK